MSEGVGQPDGARILYVTYDGLTDPLGRSQILPYLIRLTKCGHRITILSCEKPGPMRKDGERVRAICSAAGMQWHPIAYHKQPSILSSAIDAALLRRAALKLHRRYSFDVVHCRSYIPGRVGLSLKRCFGTKFLFDMRGFWPDEKVEGHNWNLANPFYRAVYRYFKALESRLLSNADQIISLTHAGSEQLRTRPELAGTNVPIAVIPCCVDFDHFPLATAEVRSTVRQQLGIGSRDKVLVYLGSLGSWYMLDEMLDFYRVYEHRFGLARLLLITPDDPQPIGQAAAARGIDAEKLTILSATREEVPELMAAADLGIFFIKPVFSKIASSPTKMGEMLAVGLPIVANVGIGDVEAVIRDTDCGVAIRDFGPESYLSALDELDDQTDTAADRRARARPLFDIALGVARYDQAYREMIT